MLSYLYFDQHDGIYFNTYKYMYQSKLTRKWQWSRPFLDFIAILSERYSYTSSFGGRFDFTSCVTHKHDRLYPFTKIKVPA